MFAHDRLRHNCRLRALAAASSTKLNKIALRQLPVGEPYLYGVITRISGGAIVMSIRDLEGISL